VGRILTDDDDRLHAVQPVPNWNESRYVDVWDAAAGVGAWLRIGNRPNEGHAEMSVCVHLPDGSTACAFRRPTITGNELEVDGQRWEVVEPWRTTRVRYDGPLHLLADAWSLTSGRRAFEGAPVVDASLDLTCTTTGLDTTLGRDQDHVGLIFVPGQADGHYQHLARTTGTVRIGDRTWEIDGRGGKDHSWGPRNWHAKVAFRWLIASFDDDNGFMLTRSISPTVATRGGFWLRDGELHLVDTWKAVDQLSGPPQHRLERVEVEVTAGGRTLRATGTARAWVPLRHRQRDAEGVEQTLRIVKAPTEWVTDDGRAGSGMAEYHDLLVDGRPREVD
jgi:hypothetical protein